METSEVEKEVEDNPGITFTELKDRLDLANGQLQYHLNRSDVFQKERGYTTEKACEKCIFKGRCGKVCRKTVLRDEKKEKILEKLRKDRKKEDIAEEIGISQSTLTYHVNKLKEAGFLD